MLPLLWYKLVKNDFLTFTNIMVVWFALTLMSMIISIFIGPWNNLEVDSNAETVMDLWKTGKELIKLESKTSGLLGGKVPKIEFLNL